VPVERCRQLIADVTGAAIPEGFIHSCPAKAASLAAGVVRSIDHDCPCLPLVGRSLSHAVTG
jgi:hypothetical protein